MRTNSLMLDGTVLMSLTWSRLGISPKAKAFSATSTAPPQLRGTKISKMERSKQIEVEASTPASSSCENTSCAQFTNIAGLRWRIIAPLGLPVEPEV